MPLEDRYQSKGTAHDPVGCPLCLLRKEMRRKSQISVEFSLRMCYNKIDKKPEKHVEKGRYSHESNDPSAKASATPKKRRCPKTSSGRKKPKSHGIGKGAPLGSCHYDSFTDHQPFLAGGGPDRGRRNGSRSHSARRQFFSEGGAKHPHGK